MNKIIVSGISMMLMVAAAIGVVAFVNRSGDKEEQIISPHINSVASFCEATDYKESCLKTVGRLQTADLRELVKQAILEAQEAVKKAFNSSESWIKEAKNGTGMKMALEDCKDLMDLAHDSLQEAVKSVGDVQTATMRSLINDLRTWLSAVMSYATSCVDGLDDGDSMRATVSGNLDEVSQLTSKALAIVTKVPRFLRKLGLQISIPTGLRSMSTSLPDWFSKKDRKLLAMIGNSNLKPNAVVAQDGSGQFKTIMAALQAAPKKSPTRHIIYVKAGVYNEAVMVDKTMTNILMYGDGPRRTIVTGKKNFGIMGVKTQNTATFTAIGNGFIARSMGFENTAGPEGHQAVALRVTSDKSAFFNCNIDGFQDTLYTHANRQYYRDCVISGTVDFIFGDAPVVIQNSMIVVRKPMDNQFNAVTAQGKVDKNENTAIVIQGCRIVPGLDLNPDRLRIKTYLGRPWKAYSTTVFIENEIGDLIQPAGWKEWEGTKFLDTLFYAEYNNKGPGANTAQRVNWPGYHRTVQRKDVQRFTVQNLLHGQENWLPATGVPFTPGLTP